MSVAIVHDYLNQPGGAERTVLEIARLWPRATIYTSLYRPRSTWDGFSEFDVRTTALDSLPVDGRFRALLPIYPAAFRSLGVLDEDLVISSSSGFAHGVRTAGRSLHIVYCYTPARWLYSNGYLRRRLQRMAFAPAGAALRAWDGRAARRADAYIAIAAHVRERIFRAYGIDSDLVYPPVDVERFRPLPRGDRLLVVSRLLPYKRVDLVVRAATQAKLSLDVVGDGPALDALRRAAGPTVVFHGRLADAEVTRMIESCNAVCFPGEEDFGIVPVEANAAGKPVVAYGAGGSLETLEEGRSGAFFHEQTPEAVLGAIRRVRDLETPPDELAALASRFSVAAFGRNLRSTIGRIGERR